MSSTALTTVLETWAKVTGRRRAEAWNTARTVEPSAAYTVDGSRGAGPKGGNGAATAEVAWLMMPTPAATRPLTPAATMADAAMRVRKIRLILRTEVSA